MSKFRIDKVGAIWICRCSFYDRAWPKEAGFRWNPIDKIWWTPQANVAARLMKEEEGKAVIEVDDAKHKLREAMIATSSASAADIEIPTNAGNIYLPYQCAGVAGLLNRTNCLLADDPGLGKTIQVCGLINLVDTIRKVLIVCPLSLSINWRKELRKWLVRPYNVAIFNSLTFMPQHADISIIHYDVLLKHVEALRSISWDLVVADECHLLKNQAARRTRSLLGIDTRTANAENERNKKKYDEDLDNHRRWPGDCKHPVRKPVVYPLTPVRGTRNVFLTGTPLPNRPKEGWPIFHHLDPVEFKSHTRYKALYCGATEFEVVDEETGQERTVYDDSGHSNLGALQKVLRGTIMIRRLKKDVLKELPAKRRCIIEIPHGHKAIVEAELAAYLGTQEEIKRIREEARTAKEKDNQAEYALAVSRLKKAKVAAFELIARQRHETGTATLPYLIDHLQSIIEEGEKVIVFMHHVDLIEAIMARFGKKCVALYGKISAAPSGALGGISPRQANVDRFQNDPSCMMIVGNYGPMGMGWTLTAANRVVAGELDWVPGNMTQAEDRAHRIGQHDMVLVEHLVLQGSLAAYMAQKVVEKQEVQTAALDTDVPDFDIIGAFGASVAAGDVEAVASASQAPAVALSRPVQQPAPFEAEQDDFDW